MKKKILIIGVGIFFIFFVIYIFNMNNDKNLLDDEKNLINNEKNENTKIYNKENIEIYEQKYKINGESMLPLIHSGKLVNVKINYYNSGKNTVKSGDIIIFENPFTYEKIIKKVSIIPNDTVVYNSKNQTLKVNNKILKNSAGKNYIFTKDHFKMIKIYLKDGKITENVYFIFGDNIDNSIDSRSFGPIPLEGILGKVEL